MPDRASRAAGLGPFLWLVLVAFGILFGGFLVWSQQSERGALEHEYSTYRSDESGARAFFLTLEGLGMRPQRWQADFTALPSPGLLFILAPAAARSGGAILPYEIEALDDWVRRGSTLVVMGERKNPLYQALGVFTSVPKRPRPAGGYPVAEPAQPGRLAAGVKEIHLQSGRAFRFGREKEERSLFGGEEEPDLPQPIQAPGEDEWLTLFGTRADPVVITTSRGKGQYLLVSDAHPAGTLALAIPDNLHFMVNLASLAGEGALLFDEAHHRSIRRGFVAYARARRFTPFLIYLLALLAVLLWRSGVRFGNPVPLVADPRRDTREYVDAVATLYRNAGMARDALAAGYEQFRRRAAVRLGLSGAWRPETVAPRLAARTGRPEREVWQTLNEIEGALARPALREAEAFALAQRLAALEREVEGV